MAPEVTGISPKEGVPGTKITLRGTDFGTSYQDIEAVCIGGWDVTLTCQWYSPHKLTVLAGPVLGVCEVLVCTRSSGQGTFTVTFTCTAPVFGAFREACVWSPVFETDRQTILAELSASMHSITAQEDVLGILAEDSVCTEYSEERLQTMFPDGASSNLYSRDFSPYRFLLEYHSGSEYTDLRAGIGVLRRRISCGVQTAQLVFLKHFAPCLLEQLRALEALRLAFSVDGRMLANVEAALCASKSRADALLSGLVSGQARAERLRAVLGLLRRYQPVLCAAESIGRYVSAGQYDLVLSEYWRVRSLISVLESQHSSSAGGAGRRSRVLAYIMARAHTQIARVRDNLEQQLTQICGVFGQQQKLLRCLSHITHDTMLSGSSAATAASGDKTSGKRSADIGMLCVQAEYEHVRHFLEDSMQTEPTHSIEQHFIAFCDKFSTLLGSYNRVAAAYLNCELAGTFHSQPDSSAVERRRLQLIVHWCNAARAVLLPHTLTTEWSHLVTADTERLSARFDEARAAGTCLQALLRVAATAGEYDSDHEVQALVSDWRKHCLSREFIESTSQLQTMGCCDTDRIVEALEARVRALVERVAVVAPQSLLQQPSVYRHLVILVYNLFASFGQLLERQAYRVSHDEAETPIAASEAPSAARAQQMLDLCAVCHRVRVTQARRLCTHFVRVHLPAAAVEEAVGRVASVLGELEGRLIDVYIEEKMDTLFAELEVWIGRDFDQFAQLTAAQQKLMVGHDVRPYVHELVSRCVLAHAEIYARAECLLLTIMRLLLEAIVARVCYAVESAVDDHVAGGGAGGGEGAYVAQQTRLEMLAVREVLAQYVDDTDSVELFAKLMQILPPDGAATGAGGGGESECSRLVTDRLRASMRFQLRCLS